MFSLFGHLKLLKYCVEEKKFTEIPLYVLLCWHGLIEWGKVGIDGEKGAQISTAAILTQRWVSTSVTSVSKPACTNL